MIEVPLHSLVIMIGPSGSGKSTFARNTFPNYEIVSTDAIRVELSGDILDMQQIGFAKVL